MYFNIQPVITFIHSLQSLERMASAEVSTPAPAAVPAVVPAPVANATAATDMVKTEQAKPAKKKFSWKGLKKVGPIRLVKGFRAATLRPKIALDSQKDVADNVRQKLFERRNKYEKFVDKVLGKASPVKSEKQPAPGGVAHDGKLNQKQKLYLTFMESKTATLKHFFIHHINHIDLRKNFLKKTNIEFYSFAFIITINFY